jgi:hypothetical protein
MASPDWTALPKDHLLMKFANDVESIVEAAGYNEMYGVQLQTSSEYAVALLNI